MRKLLFYFWMPFFYIIITNASALTDEYCSEDYITIGISKYIENDFESAFLNLSKSESCNIVLVNFLLGDMYTNEELPFFNLEKGFELLETASAQGNALADRKLAIIYDEGRLVDKDTGKYCYYVKKAADNNEKIAQYLYYLSLENEECVDSDSKESRYYLSMSADNMFPPALSQVGFEMIMTSEDSDERENGLKLLEIAASSGYVKAQKTIFYLYERGDYLDIGCKKAKKWIDEAAKSGDDDSVKKSSSFSCGQ